MIKTFVSANNKSYEVTCKVCSSRVGAVGVVVVSGGRLLLDTGVVGVVIVNDNDLVVGSSWVGRVLLKALAMVVLLLLPAVVEDLETAVRQRNPNENEDDHINAGHDGDLLDAHVL